MINMANVCGSTIDKKTCWQALVYPSKLIFDSNINFDSNMSKRKIFD